MESFQSLSKLLHFYPHLILKEEGGEEIPGFNAVIMENFVRDACEYMSRCCYMQTADLVLANLYRVFKAVQTLHEKGICHGDLKPGNLLLDKNEKLYLADFGMATTEDFSSGGTLEYTCGTDIKITERIEQILESKGQDPENTEVVKAKVQRKTIREAGDLFALGLMTHLMLTGCEAYRVIDRRPVTRGFDSTILNLSCVLAQLKNEGNRKKLAALVTRLISSDYQKRHCEPLKLLEAIIHEEFPGIQADIEKESGQPFAI